MKIFIWIIVFLVVFFLYVKYLERRSYYFPSKNLEATPESVNLQYEDIYFTTADNKKLNGWLIPGEPAKYTVIFCHGNAGNISHRLEKILFFHAIGITTFIFDYRGYGKSEGSPSEQGLYHDTEAAYRYLTEKRSIPKDRIILYGESLGGAAAIDCASQYTVGGLIVEDTFTSVRDMAKKYYPFVPRFLISNLFDSLTKIKNISCPKLIIHSEEDEIAPFSHGEKLFREAQPPKYFTKTYGNHNDAFFNSIDSIKKDILLFLEKL